MELNCSTVISLWQTLFVIDNLETKKNECQWPIIRGVSEGASESRPMWGYRTDNGLCPSASEKAGTTVPQPQSPNSAKIMWV